MFFRTIRSPFWRFIVLSGLLLLLLGGLPVVSAAPVVETHPQASPFDCSAVGEIPLAECQALEALYNSTGGANWTENTGWLQTDTSPCADWHGITCRDGHVIEISLSDNHLVGSIPPALQNLAYLETLVLDFNDLSGPLPSELGELTRLAMLYLSNNQLSGAIPATLGNLGNLQRLYLYSNELTGAIPPALGNLSSVQQLHLSSNQLSGSIPPDLGRLDNLQWLLLNANQLSGPIPPELGNLDMVENLSLGGNQLTGTIPPELGNLATLSQLGLSSNQLTGPIPPELGNLINLWTLSLSSNQLSGTIPSELGDLATLRGLHLDNNQLTGPLPSEIGELANLAWLIIDHNQLSGPLPLSLTGLANLYEFSFYYTELCRPPETAFLEWLDTIDVLRAREVECSYTISGRITSGGIGLADIYVAAGGWDGAVTDATGAYTVTGVFSGTYTLTPMSPGCMGGPGPLTAAAAGFPAWPPTSAYEFEPPMRSVAVPPDVTGQDFVATKLNCPRWLYLPLLASK